MNAASLEELMDMEISSVNRRPQKLSEAAAAIYIITREDIRRFGANSIPEALRMAPGIQVAQIDASKWAITARGFNGRFANKVLVLIDGRTVYTSLYSGVYWDQNDVMLEDVERIEVIRGPGATMWGANAVNGVINIITRPAGQTQGGLISVASATDEPGSFAARYGGKAGEKIAYRLFAKYFDRGNQVNADGSPSFDAWHSLRIGGRLDYELSTTNRLSFEGDLYDGRSHESISNGFFLPSLTPPMLDRDSFRGGYALGRWEHQISARSETALQVYYNEEDRKEAAAIGTFRTVDLDFQHRIHLTARNDLVWGAGSRFSWDDIPSNLASVGVSFHPVSREVNLFSTFLQESFAVIKDRLVLSAGSKLQYGAYGGFQAQPRIQALWSPSKRQTFWVSASRAVRTPARRDQDISIQFSIPAPGSPLPVYGRLNGNYDFEPERLAAYEAGFRRQWRRNFSTDIAAFFNNYTKLQAIDQGAPYYDVNHPSFVVPLVTDNDGAAKVKGLEVSATWTPSAKWKLSGNVSWLHLSEGGARDQVFDSSSSASWNPSHQWHLRSEWQALRRLSVDSAIYSVAALPGQNIPAYTRVDSRLGWRLQERLELSIGAKNLLDPRHPEFVSEDYVRSSETRRSVYTKLMWAF